MIQFCLQISWRITSSLLVLLLISSGFHVAHVAARFRQLPRSEMTAAKSTFCTTLIYATYSLFRESPYAFGTNSVPRGRRPHLDMTGRQNNTCTWLVQTSYIFLLLYVHSSWQEVSYGCALPCIFPFRALLVRGVFVHREIYRSI